MNYLWSCWKCHTHRSQDLLVFFSQTLLFLHLQPWPDSRHTSGAHVRPPLAPFLSLQTVYWHPIKREQKCSLNISLVSWKSGRIDDSSIALASIETEGDWLMVVRENVTGQRNLGQVSERAESVDRIKKWICFCHLIQKGGGRWDGWWL